MAKLSNQDVRALLEAEREKVLAQLAGFARKEKAAAEKSSPAVVAQGRAPPPSCSRAAHSDHRVTDSPTPPAVTRQMAHHWLRDEE